MELINTITGFIQNPDNSRILFSMAIFLIVTGIVLRLVKKRILTIKGDNTGIVVNGDVTGNIKQTQQQPPSANSNRSSSIIGIVGAISSILGLLLTAIAFYISYVK